MNKLLVLYFILSSLFVYSQESRRFQLGYEASAIISQVGGDNTAGFRKFGGGLGLTSTLVLPSENKFKFGITYIQKGSRVYPDYEFGIEEYRLSVDYIEVPFIWELDILENWFEIGLTASRAISLNERRNRIDFIDPEPAKAAEVGFIVGYKYPVNDKTALHLRYGNSLSPFRDHPGGATWLLNLGQMHSYFQLTFSQSFGG